MNEQALKPSRWLMAQAKQHRAPIAVAVILNFCFSLATIVQVGALAYIIYDAFILKFSVSQLHRPFFLFLFMIALRSLLAWGKEMAGFRIGARVRRGVRQALLQHINSLGPIQTSVFGTGALSASVIEQVESLQDFYAYYLPMMFQVVLVPIVILVIVASLNWLSALILFICGPLIPFFMALVGMGAASANQRSFKTLSRMSTHFLDILQGLTTLKLFDQSKIQAKKIAAVSDAYRKETMRVLRIAFMSSGVLEFFSAVSIALVAVILGLSLLGHIHVGDDGHLTLFSALFVLLLAPEYFLPLRELGVHYHARAQAIAAAEEIIHILKMPPNKTDQLLQVFDADQLTVTFENVSFGYHEAEGKILKQICFRLNAGEKIYIVGESGAGKTTILNILMGFLQPTQGCIKINDRDLNLIHPKDWYRHISWVGQHPRLFQASVRENLLMAKANATPEEMQQALVEANLVEFVQSLPDGIDTEIGEQNFGLSGGQAQRLALARAFLRNGPLLLLDEPTASLDQQTKQQILQSLAKLAQNKTVITLTHDLHDIPADARVLLLEKGVIVAQGKYAELATQHVFFQKLDRSERGAA